MFAFFRRKPIAELTLEPQAYDQLASRVQYFRDMLAGAQGLSEVGETIDIGEFRFVRGDPPAVAAPAPVRPKRGSAPGAIS